MFPLESRVFHFSKLPMLMLGAACLLSAVAGCGRRVVVTSPGESTSGDPSEQPKDHCEELLKNAVGMAQPGRLGVSTDRRQVSELFNQWRGDCGGDVELAAFGAHAKKAFEPLVSDAEFKAMAEGRISERDAETLRTAILLKRAGDVVVKSADRDIDRVNLLFQFVVRNVALSAPSSEPIPQTPYDILILGRGSAEERAWLFAELLRQLRIDAVILKPATGVKSQSEAAKAETTESKPDPEAATSSGSEPSTADEAPWLVGVLLDEPQKPVYLFDLWLGLPVPAPDDSAFPPRPATLEQVVEKPEILGRLAQDEGTYRFAPEAFHSMKVEVISSADPSLPRQKRLQSVLTGDDAVVLFDPLDDDEESPGLVSRVEAFGGKRWGKTDISVWSFPERSLVATEHLTDRQQQRQRIRRHALDAPISIIPKQKKDENGQERIEITFGNPKKTQLKTRIAQVLGDRKNAVRSYNLVRFDGRLDPRLQPPPEFVRMHARAEEDAFFWTGICQYEGGEFDAAASTFRDYLARYPQGDWADHAREMQARAFARQQKFADAFKALETLSEADPARVAHQVLRKTFRSLQQSAAKTSE
ncbi:MAG: tetratricopeptide repeat protein [Planctomycetaceae bacterium]|nr:tetratricopeptide repeat protein [Planctomycetaceae bacterium]